MKKAELQRQIDELREKVDLLSLRVDEDWTWRGVARSIRMRIPFLGRPRSILKDILTDPLTYTTIDRKDEAQKILVERHRRRQGGE